MNDTSTPFTMLIVEDDQDIRAGLRDYFEINGYNVELASDGEEAISKLLSNPDYDIVLLDVMLPKKDGFQVLRESQDVGISAPVLMITGRGEQENKLKGFGLGVQDYVTKPFDVDELAARVKAILVRTQPPDKTPMDIYQIGDVTINFSTHEASRDGEEIPFTALEYDILHYLITNRNHVVTRKQLLRDVWGISQDIETRTIDRHIASLRKKIEPNPANPEHIETVYGIGYRYKD